MSLVRELERCHLVSVRTDFEGNICLWIVPLHAYLLPNTSILLSRLP